MRRIVLTDYDCKVDGPNGQQEIPYNVRDSLVNLLFSPDMKLNGVALVRANTVAQKDLVGAVRTIAAARGWRVIDLHGSHQNPGQPSVPDLLITREDSPPTMVKILGPKGELSKAQRDWMAHYEVCGFATATYAPDDFEKVLEALA